MILDISRIGNETVVMLDGNNFGNNLTISDATITTSNGISYQASAMQCNMADGFATIRAKFPEVSDLKDARITMSVNGEPLSLALNDLNNNSGVDGLRIVGVGTIHKDSLSSVSPIKIRSTSISDTQYKIYVDDKEVTEAEFKEISPDKIESITVEPLFSTISVVLRK